MLELLIQAFNRAIKEGRRDVAIGIKRQIALIDTQEANKLMLSGVAIKKDNPFKKSIPNIKGKTTVKKKPVAVNPVKQEQKPQEKAQEETESNVEDGLTVEQLDSFDFLMENNTKKEIIEKAKELGIDFNQRESKEEIVRKIVLVPSE